MQAPHPRANLGRNDVNGFTPINPGCRNAVVFFTLSGTELFVDVESPFLVKRCDFKPKVRKHIEKEQNSYV
jgi:hypothetical protein